MIEVNGKVVYTTLAELILPRHSALIVVDMQHDFCMPGGAFELEGADISVYRMMIPRLGTLLETARNTGLLVVHLQMSTLPDGRSDSPAQLRFNMLARTTDQRRPARPLRYTIEGTKGEQSVPALSPRLGDVVVKKHRSSGFWGTNLDLILRSNGIQTAVITGCTTEGCVESTARDALFNDYYVVVVEDCVASDDPEQHAASILLMRHRFDLASSTDVIATWQRMVS
jgi:nicotinamidase-related amidase